MGRAKGTAAERERRKQLQREWQREQRRREMERLAADQRPTLYGLLDAADVKELERRKAKFAAA